MILFAIYALYFLPSSISGNEVLFSLETASDYVKDEKACFYGFKCVAVGFEFNPGLDEVRKKKTLKHSSVGGLFCSDVFVKFVKIS